MKRLFHWPLDPLARTVRLVLGEKGMNAALETSLPWSPNPEVARLAHGAVSPALVDQGGHGRVVTAGPQAICEYLEDEGGARLLPLGPQDKAEARRMWRWCEDAFADVNASLLTERVSQWVRRDREPDSSRLRRGAHALRNRMTFLNALCEERNYIAGRHLTIADLSAAAHLSAYDYFGDVPWDNSPDLREWYARIKSRPSFRPLLSDRVDGARPAKHYADLDF